MRAFRLVVPDKLMLILFNDVSITLVHGGRWKRPWLRLGNVQIRWVYALYKEAHVAVQGSSSVQAQLLFSLFFPEG